MLPPTSKYLDKYQSTYIIPLKELQFVGSSLDELRRFPAAVRQLAGFELDQIQRGRMPSDFKPLLGVGPGAYEIRIHIDGEWRIIYVAKFSDKIYVLHAFQKKTQRTRKEDIQLAVCRYKEARSDR